jgi:hypothetical protein
MRLFEFANDAADQIETVLRNILGSADTNNQTAQISYQQLSNLLNPLGYGEMDYDAFKAIHDSDSERFNDIVDNFDSEGITLKTKAQTPQQTLTPKGSSGKSVDQMAHNVVSKELS